MTIKTKISLGLAFLFGVIVLLGSLGAFYLYQLSEESKKILKDNYISLEYIQNIREVIQDGQIGRLEWAEVRKNLDLQQKNITEPGEGAITQRLQEAFAMSVDTGTFVIPATQLTHIYPLLDRLVDVNMQAMIRKNAQAESKAEQIRTYMILILTVCSLITFSFIVNFPGYIANPIRELTKAIGQIARKNYSQRVHFQTNDEFGQLAASFNDMALRLEQYEHSNLARLIFEKRRIETIIDNLKDGILGLDEKGRILFLNPVMELLLGLSEPVITGKYAPDVALHNDLLRHLLAGDLLAGEPTMLPLKIFADNQESYFTRETHDVFLAEDNYPAASQSQNEKATTAGRVIVLKNITAFRERDLAKTNFIATISHELKTPISSIKMSVKLLKDQRVGPLNPEQASLLSHIHDDSERLLKITGELLDLSQVETGNIQLAIRPVAPQTIVSYALQAVGFQASQRGIELHSQLADDLPAVQADLEKTAWVLINFLSNALRFSREGATVTIAVETTQINQQSQVRFAVQDSGKGIERKYLDRIFERYFQVPDDNPSQTGTGLGLAICKEFIEAQKGQIWAESTSGVGSIFYFSLPVDVAEL